MLVAIAVLVAAGGRAVLQEAKVDSAADAAAHAGVTALFDYANDIVPDQTEIDAAEDAANPSDSEDPVDDESVAEPLPEGEIPLERERLVMRWIQAAWGTRPFTPAERTTFSWEISQLSRTRLLGAADGAAHWVVSQTAPQARKQYSYIEVDAYGVISYEIGLASSMDSGASQVSAELGAKGTISNDTVSSDASARASLRPR